MSRFSLRLMKQSFNLKASNAGDYINMMYTQATNQLSRHCICINSWCVENHGPKRHRGEVLCHYIQKYCYTCN